MVTKEMVIPLVVAVVLLIIVFAHCFPWPGKPLTVPLPSESQRFEEEEIVPPPATSNIDDIVDALMKELDDEKLLLDEGERDVDLINADSQEVGNFGQAINESEL